MRISIGMLTLVLISPAFAQDVSGTYLGISVGTTDYVEVSTAAISADDFEANASATRLYGGYRFGRSFALELGYGETGKLDDTIDLGGFAPASMSANIGGEYKTTSLRAMAFIPLKKERLPLVSIGFFLGIGAYDSEFDASGTIQNVGTIDVTEQSDGTMATTGVQIDLPKISIRGEYEWYDSASTVDIGTVGIGLHYRF